MRDGVEVAHVEMLDPDSELVELAASVADGGDDIPAVGGILAGELKADSSVRACDQDCWHGR
jgi:hypothetical protein